MFEKERVYKYYIYIYIYIYIKSQIENACLIYYIESTILSIESEKRKKIEKLVQ